MAGDGFTADLGQLDDCSQEAEALSTRALGLQPQIQAAAQGIQGAAAVGWLQQVQAKVERDLDAWSECSKWYGIRLDIARAA